MKNFRTYQLALDLYKAIKKNSFSGPEKNQILRASLSIALNLAEGSAKPTVKDRKRFYAIALGSLRETQCILQLTEKRDLINLADKLAAHLYKLHKS